ncbi:MAG: nucleotidyltransferase domain-containing protein [Candidatus Schekmanbacteria bacterium]|nr:nucleotidyltransferase domain-containing protein [Candidatus Schekmanbacteria bacterium]
MPKTAALIKQNQTHSLGKAFKWLTENERRGVEYFAEKVKELLGEKLLELKLFGSKVRGDFDEESDIDILVVIDSEDWRFKEKISYITADANIDFDCNLSPVIYYKKDHEKNKYFNTLFIQELENQGIPI